MVAQLTRLWCEQASRDQPDRGGGRGGAAALRGRRAHHRVGGPLARPRHSPHILYEVTFKHPD